jgi:hypothetical protein
MNPYLEHPATWPDFHNSLITYMREMLNRAVGDRYFVSIEEQVYIHELPADQWRPIGRVDVTLSPVTSAASSTAGLGVLAAPQQATLVQAVDTVNQPYLEIRDRRDGEVVTVIEILRPSNKRLGADREQYSQKRLRLFRGPANFVEIDLLRGGPRHSFESEKPSGDYYALVARPLEWPKAGLWPIRLRERLPVIQIPLRTSEPTISLDLQELLHRAYDSAGYHKVIYLRPPDPALSPDDAEWAKQFVPGK